VGGARGGRRGGERTRGCMFRGGGKGAEVRGTRLERAGVGGGYGQGRVRGGGDQAR